MKINQHIFDLRARYQAHLFAGEKFEAEKLGRRILRCLRIGCAAGMAPPFQEKLQRHVDDLMVDGNITVEQLYRQIPKMSGKLTQKFGSNVLTVTITEVPPTTAIMSPRCIVEIKKVNYADLIRDAEALKKANK